jgi:hypothetical protein
LGVQPMENWSNAFDKLGMTPDVDNDDAARLAHVDNCRRVLQWPSVSTGGLIVFLCRWTYRSASKGGIVTESARSRVERFLDGLLDFVSDEPFTVPVVLGGYSLSFPAEAAGHRVLYLQVLQGGIVDVGAFIESLAADSGFDLSCKVKLMAALHEVNPRTQLKEFLRKFEGCSLAALGFQLVCSIGSHIEAAVSRMIEENAVHRSTVTIASVPWSAGGQLQVERDLALHVMAGKIACDAQVPLRLSFTSDKSNVHSMGLQNWFGAVPTNKVFAAPPVVPRLESWSGLTGPVREGSRVAGQIAMHIEFSYFCVFSISKFSLVFCVLFELTYTSFLVLLYKQVRGDWFLREKTCLYRSPRNPNECRPP